MTVAVFTPTCRPGLDVAVRSLERQNRDDLLWIVGDDLYQERDAGHATAIATVHFDTAVNRHNQPSSLAFAYRRAIDIARDHGADLFVSMQDYVWIPDDGVARFERMAREFPTSLLTGLCSLSNDPYPREVLNPTDLYGIFAEPFDGRQPTDIRWVDCRLEVFPDNAVSKASAIWWETNWAAIPRNILHDKRLNFNEEYCRGHGYENQDYALRAEALGYDVWIDTANHAIGLPHEQYFPADADRLVGINNREWHEARYAH